MCLALPFFLLTGCIQFQSALPDGKQPTVYTNNIEGLDRCVEINVVSE